MRGEVFCSASAKPAPKQVLFPRRGTTNARFGLVCHRQTACQGLEAVLRQNAPDNTRNCFSAFATRSDEQDAGVSARYKPTYV